MRQKDPEIHANTKPVLRILSQNKNEAKKVHKFTQILSLYYEFYFKSKVRQKSTEIDANTKPVLRILFQIKSEAKIYRN